jgi:hypothetical protein
LLTYLGGAGLVLALWPWMRAWLPGAARAAPGARRVPMAWAAFGLAVAIPIMTFYAAWDWKAQFPDPKVQVAIQSFQAKVDYWIPWVLAFPAGYAAAVLFRRVSPRLTVALVLLLLVFPWREKWWMPIDPGFADPNYHQHSIAEAWAYQVENGFRGYWGATPDRRWAQTPEELEASEVLLAEVAAGRITMDTTVVHLGPYTYLYKDNFLFTVYTGINGDCYITKYKFDWSIAGGRLRSIDDWPARLATRPPYIAIHHRVDPGDPDNVDPTPFAGDLSEYDEIYGKGNVRLYRHRSVAPTAG